MKKICTVILLSVFLHTALKAQYIAETPSALFGTAAHVNASNLDDFHEGYAIVRKGENFAMIDKDGKFFIPYGKYKFNKPRAFQIDDERCGFYNGMCAVRDPDSEAYGFIDLTGKLVVPCTLKDVAPFVKDGYAWAKQNDAHGREEQIYIDKAGNKYRIKDQSLFYHNIQEPYPMRGQDGYTWFYNKNGKFVFKTKKWYNGDFSEGMLRVDTAFELAGRKIGFIDLKGKLAIPYKFKFGSRVEKFSDGLALYTPPTRDEFEYVFINKVGEMVIKLHSSEEYGNISFSNARFENGYALGRGKKPLLLDQEGNMTFITELIEKNNPAFTSKFTSFEIINTSEVKKRGRYIKFEAFFSYQVKKIGVSGGLNGGQRHEYYETINRRGYGIADVTGKIIIPPIYYYCGFPDPVSGLARVTYHIIRPEEGDVKLDGYANSEKAFAIILDAKN